MGDTGFEPVTSSVSGQNLRSGIKASVASEACARSLMFATMRVGWPTVWPTANRLPPAGVGICRTEGVTAEDVGPSGSPIPTAIAIRGSRKGRNARSAGPNRSWLTHPQ